MNMTDPENIIGKIEIFIENLERYAKEDNETAREHPFTYRLTGYYTGRAEAFACKNSIGASAIDGISMGLGYSMALTILGSIREILGSGSIFGWKFIEGDAILVFVLAPGAFIAMGYLIAIMNRLLKKSK